MPLPIPKFIKTAFANIGLRNNIPEITNNTTGAAGYDRGFGKINMLPEGAGGIPPDGKDFNGVFYDMSAAIQYIQAGRSFPFNQDFAIAIGGYEIGAIVSDASNESLIWINGTASNIAFPTGWTQFTLSQATETLRGTLRIGTQAQVEAGTLDTVAVTPKKLRAGFVFSTGETGFISFPTWLGGVIIQWSSVAIPASQGAYTFPLAVAFPGAPFQAVACFTSDSAMSACVESISKTHITIFADYISGPVLPTRARYICVGN